MREDQQRAAAAELEDLDELLERTGEGLPPVHYDPAVHGSVTDYLRLRGFRPMSPRYAARTTEPDYEAMQERRHEHRAEGRDRGPEWGDDAR